jgi:hypothetical protein
MNAHSIFTFFFWFVRKSRPDGKRQDVVQPRTIFETLRLGNGGCSFVGNLPLCRDLKFYNFSSPVLGGFRVGFPNCLSEGRSFFGDRLSSLICSEEQARNRLESVLHSFSEKISADQRFSFLRNAELLRLALGNSFGCC